MLQSKKIILAVTGSIAAYKAAFLTRLLIKAGAEVQVIMTPAAKEFITSLTLSTLSKRPVYSEVISDESWNNHVELGLWADAMIIAPCTASTLAKLANGLCDSIVVATYLSARCPVYFAPAMDLDMWKHPATQRNLDLLLSYGNRLIPVEHGELASGLVGKGRMAEPENIVQLMVDEFATTQSLKHLKVMITAGPTYEAIDPVRFIGNRSSGKMGLSLANKLAEKGAKVTLILGPSKLEPNKDKMKLIRVESAKEMYDVSMKTFPKSDVAIMAAAVADYRPKEIANQKIKKKTNNFQLDLEKTEDIAESLGKIKRKDQICIGFALETNNELTNAEKKLTKKNFDFIVLNSLRDKGAGFNHNTNKITIVKKGNKIKKFKLKSKDDVALDIIDEMINVLNKGVKGKEKIQSSKS